MTIQAAKFTPEVLLSAPRRSTGSPNCTGKLVLFTKSAYSFDNHLKSDQIGLLDVETARSTVLVEGGHYGSPEWIGEHEIIFLDSSSPDATKLVYMDVRSPSLTPTIQRINGSITGIKTKCLCEGEVALACSAVAGPDGHMHRPSRQKEASSSARIYTSLYARHWDSWNTRNKNSIWYGRLVRHGGNWCLERPGLVNALAGTKLECPIPPFGGTGDFDICATGLAFVARDPDLSPAEFTKSDLYYLPLHPDTPSAFPAPQSLPHLVETGHLVGYTNSPTFSHCGGRIAFTRMRHIQYEADKTRLMLIPDVSDLANVQEFFATDDGEGKWHLSPSSVAWSNDDSELYVTAEKHGRHALWKLPADPVKAVDLPHAIHSNGSVLGFSPLTRDVKERRIFVSTSSLVDSSAYYVLDPDAEDMTLVSSMTKEGRSLGLSKKQCTEFWFQGCDGRRVHALVVRPSNFDESKKYPLAFLIHGGPQGAWADSWSTRWNPAVFAEQGYVAVMPNPTGSTGYGQDFTDRIQCEWGGRPYTDLEKCWEHIRDCLPYVDVECGVALGASYGGYMINWIQGHSLGRKFKALVCHDGVFSTVNQWSTEELFFPLHEFGGPLWKSRSIYEKWDPSKFTDAWATPMLVVHSEMDYRLPISEGLAMFNVLQAKKIPSKLVMFPDENHWVLKPENSRVWHREVLDFINNYSGITSSDQKTVI